MITKLRTTMITCCILLTVLALCLLIPARWVAAQEAAVLHIASRLELFVDHYLIERLDGTRLELHQPQSAGVALKFDRPWEGGGSSYFTVLKDGQKYRMYYRGSGADGVLQVTCYAESTDGKNWTKPNLGLFGVKGTRENNVILTPKIAKRATHNFCPFIDSRPGVPRSERYKAMAGSSGGLVPFVSADGIHWRLVSEQPVITKGAFDSQNVPFWSEHEECYVCYFRIFAQGVRSVARATSKDFLNWSEPVPMSYGSTPHEHIYTNGTHPYFRAPQLYIALARRFMPGRRVLTDAQAGELGVREPSWLKNDCSDGVLMTSRGGNRYDRTFMEAFIRPGSDPRNWVSRSNTPALGVVPTGPAEMSLYVGRHRGQRSHYLERLKLRTDGFASVDAPYAGGGMVSRPFKFSGKQLVINFATSAAGNVRVEIQQASGEAIRGYTLEEAVEIIGDEIERVVSWKNGWDVSKLAGRPVRLRFVMKDANLYSVRFR